jgi:hypothetical protein
LIVPPRNPEQTAEACLRLLSDVELRRTIGKAARARILSRFTLEQSLAIFGDLYREVTGRISSALVLKHEQDEADEEDDTLVTLANRRTRHSELPTVPRTRPVLVDRQGGRGL